MGIWYLMLYSVCTDSWTISMDCILSQEHAIILKFVSDTALRTYTLRSVRRLLVTASVVPTSPILVTLMKEALRSSETSVLTRATRRNIPEDDILHSHRRENLQSYIPVRSFP
jgi:hypothetical protein